VRALRYGLIVIALASMGTMFSALATAKPHTATQPTLTMKRDCEIFGDGVNGIRVSLSGFPPFTDFTGSLEYPDGAELAGEFTTDANGNFVAPELGFEAPGTWTATVTWSGGALTKSLYVDCTQPGAKNDCKRGGWRDYDFRNQGRCVAWIQHHRL